MKTTVITKKKVKEVSKVNKEENSSPKYKYNFSSNNSYVSYSKFEYGGNDRNKDNIYIGKRNGDTHYYPNRRKLNNFGSLTIIQHNTRSLHYSKNRYTNDNDNDNDYRTTQKSYKSPEKRNQSTTDSKSFRNTNSYLMLTTRSRYTKENNENDERKETPSHGQLGKKWTVTKEIYECKEVF